MECGSSAHCRSSGLASISGRQSSSSQARLRSAVAKHQEAERQVRTFAKQWKAIGHACEESRRGQKQLLRAALTETVDATDLDAFPRGSHWQVDIMILSFEAKPFRPCDEHLWWHWKAKSSSSSVV